MKAKWQKWLAGLFVWAGSLAPVAAQDWVSEMARQEQVPPALVWAVIAHESGGRSTAVSPRGASGLMQLMPATARALGVNPQDPRQNVRGGARYLRLLLNAFDGNLSLALAAYHAGPATVNAYRTGRALRLAGGTISNPRGLRTGGIPPYAETQQYVRKVCATYLAWSQTAAAKPQATPASPAGKTIRRPVKSSAPAASTFLF